MKLINKHYAAAHSLENKRHGNREFSSEFLRTGSIFESSRVRRCLKFEVMSFSWEASWVKFFEFGTSSILSLEADRDLNSMKLCLLFQKTLKVPQTSLDPLLMESNKFSSRSLARCRSAALTSEINTLATHLTAIKPATPKKREWICALMKGVKGRWTDVNTREL